MLAGFAALIYTCSLLCVDHGIGHFKAAHLSSGPLFLFLPASFKCRALFHPNKKYHEFGHLHASRTVKSHASDRDLPGGFQIDGSKVPACRFLLVFSGTNPFGHPSPEIAPDRTIS